MFRYLVSGAMLFLVACASAGEPPKAESVAETSAEDDIFRLWIAARAGDGAPVHWVSQGAVYAYPSGEKILGMTGFDSSRVIWPEGGEGEVIHLTRKTFTYTDPVTGEFLTEFNGQKVVPIAYPYQVIRYRMKDGLIFADVEQGVEPRVQKIESKDGIIARKVGDSWAFTAPLFLNFPLPSGGQYEAWENYDFFIHPEGSVSEPHQMSWQRLGDLPPWAGGGKGIYHLLSWRVDSVEEFPPELLEWAKAEKPLWLAPPESLEEVRRLQKGEGGPGWGQ
ncbi:DUF1838 family protein [Hyphomonas sp. NPDC076900]|uniref:DUF1838 family protein n=1 Tax=unclassified Hyphomonas TaxID=2630699 RepID=UPI003CFCC811